MTIRALIVDDEPLARRRINNLLAETEDVEVIAECANGREAIQAIEESAPDLLFLDIQMPELDGFDVLQAIGVGSVPVVIFVTAYDQFALRAFEAVPTGHRSVFIRTEDIDWIEADRNYIRLHVGGRTYRLRENLSRIESALDPAKFCRIHRSTIVNIDRIRAVESLFRGEYLLVLHDKTKLTSGRSYRRNLHRLMGKES